MTKEQLALSRRQIEINKQKELNRRQAAIRTSNDAKLNPNRYTPDNIAKETGAIGDKFRLYPNDPESFFDDYVNPAVMIGNMAADIGKIPQDIQRGDYSSAAFRTLAPIITGATAGIGAKTTGQFINNIVNPLAGLVPFRLKPNAEEIAMFKNMINPSTIEPLTQSEQNLLRSTRNIGSLSANGSTAGYTKDAVKSFENILKRGENLTDEQFTKLVGGTKEEVEKNYREVSKMVESGLTSPSIPQHNSWNQIPIPPDTLYIPTQRTHPTGEDLWEEIAMESSLPENQLYRESTFDPYDIPPPPPLNTYDTLLAPQNINYDQENSAANRFLAMSRSFNRTNTDDFLDELVTTARSNNAAVPAASSGTAKAPSKPFLFRNFLKSGLPEESSRNIDEYLLPHLGTTLSGPSPISEINNAYKKFKQAPSGKTVSSAASLSADSKPLELSFLQKALKDKLGNLNYHGEGRLNSLGFPEQAGVDPEIIMKELNNQIQKLNELGRSNIPYSRIEGGQIMYPKLSITKKQTGGKTKISDPYPYMKGSRPAIKLSNGKSAESLDGRSISMDQLYDKDSVTVNNGKATTFYKSRLNKYVKK